ncbi:MAG: hypothetical protein U5K38_07185 [Woeseiaceae bacterium]|nr:hypothetical protein [Woeseiaceae bacterium]
MTGSYALRVIVDNPDKMLMPGVRVRADVTTAVMEQGLLVPRVAVTRDAKGDASAMVVAGEGAVRKTRHLGQSHSR